MSSGFANNKGEDQPVHPHSLVSSFVIHVLERIISKLAAKEISIFMLGSIAEETGFSLVLSETPKTGFVARLGPAYVTMNATINEMTCVPRVESY